MPRTIELLIGGKVCPPANDQSCRSKCDVCQSTSSLKNIIFYIRLPSKYYGELGFGRTDVSWWRRRQIDFVAWQETYIMDRALLNCGRRWTRYGRILTHLHIAPAYQGASVPCLGCVTWISTYQKSAFNWLQVHHWEAWRLRSFG